jgi:hypothetical protein
MEASTMPRTFAAAVMLATLALLLHGTMRAGPPEGASGKMALDKVADGLRKYRNAATAEQRAVLLYNLAETRDVRVAVALGEALSDAELGDGAAIMLACCYRPQPRLLFADAIGESRRWWKANEADLRRRAAQLPR